jgi:2-keto-4-pentenoate hydratase
MGTERCCGVNRHGAPLGKSEGEVGVEGIAALVDELVAIRQDRKGLAEADAWAISTPQEAYQVQTEVAARCDWFAGGPPLFWKSGGPSRDSVLTHAPLPPAGVVRSPGDLKEMEFAMRGIEAEIALRLGQAVDFDIANALDAEGAHKLVDAMAVSIEIVDSRWQQGMSAPVLLKLADLQSHGALVLGEWVPFQTVDWAQQSCRVQIGEQPEVFQRGTHMLGDPAWLLPQWLRHACARFGKLPAGTVITTGTWVGILPAQAGDVVHVAFDGIGEARVQL